MGNIKTVKWTSKPGHGGCVVRELAQDQMREVHGCRATRFMVSKGKRGKYVQKEKAKRLVAKSRVVLRVTVFGSF